jgi:hypothetical protein
VAKLSLPANGNDSDDINASNNDVQSANGDVRRGQSSFGGSESSIGTAPTAALAGLAHIGGNDKCTAGDRDNDGMGGADATLSSPSGEDGSVSGSNSGAAALNANPDFGRACLSPLLESADPTAGPS